MSLRNRNAEAVDEDSTIWWMRYKQSAMGRMREGVLNLKWVWSGTAKQWMVRIYLFII